MARKNSNAKDNSAIKDPQEWTTGDEPMTGAQESYLHTLAREAGEPVKDDMTKAEASERIDELQEKTGRGTPARKARKRSSTRKQREGACSSRGKDVP